MLTKARVIINEKGAIIARYLLLGCFITEFILCIVILSGNSSSPSLAMTIPRMLAALASSFFVVCLIKKLLRDNYQMVTVKALACFSIILRILCFVMVKYYVRNPTEQCYVSSAASSSLSYMDVISCIAIILLAWQYIREDKISKMRMIETY